MTVPLHSKQPTPEQADVPFLTLIVKFCALINSVSVIMPWRSYPVIVTLPEAMSLLPVLLITSGSLSAVLFVVPNSIVGQVKLVGDIFIATVEYSSKLTDVLNV